MIPVTAIKAGFALARPFLPYILGALLIVSAILWFRHQLHEADRAGYRRAQNEYRQLVAEANARAEAAEAKANEVSRSADAQWQREKHDLQTRVDTLLARTPAPVRLCKPTSSGQVPAVPGATHQPDGTSADNRPTLQAGDNIGPALVVYGGDCERYRSQLSALQGWVRGQQSISRD